MDGDYSSHFPSLYFTTTLQSPQYLEFDDSVTFLLVMYLFAEGDTVLAVQDSAVDIQGGQFPQFPLIVTRTVENGPAGYVAWQGARRMMVMTPCPATQLPGCRQEQTSLPAMFKHKCIHKQKGATQTYSKGAIAS